MNSLAAACLPSTGRPDCGWELKLRTAESVDAYPQLAAQQTMQNAIWQCSAEDQANGLEPFPGSHCLACEREGVPVAKQQPRSARNQTPKPSPELPLQGVHEGSPKPTELLSRGWSSSTVSQTSVQGHPRHTELQRTQVDHFDSREGCDLTMPDSKAFSDLPLAPCTSDAGLARHRFRSLVLQECLRHFDVCTSHTKHMPGELLPMCKTQCQIVVQMGPSGVEQLHCLLCCSTVTPMGKERKSSATEPSQSVCRQTNTPPVANQLLGTHAMDTQTNVQQSHLQPARRIRL